MPHERPPTESPSITPEKAGDNPELKQAAATLDAIEAHVKEAKPNATPDMVDGVVRDYVTDAEATMQDGSSDEIMVAESAGLKIIEDPQHSDRTATALNRMPIDSLAPALTALERGKGVEAAAHVMETLDRVVHSTGPDQGYDEVVVFSSKNNLEGNVTFVSPESPDSGSPELEAVLTRIDGMPQQQIDQLYRSRDLDVMRGLTEIAKGYVDHRDPAGMSRHIKAIRAIQSTRPNLYGWRNDAENLGKLAPEPLREYAKNEGLPVIGMKLSLVEASNRMASLENDTSLTPEQAQYAREQVFDSFMAQANASISYGLHLNDVPNTRQDVDRKKMAQDYLNGDVHDFGDFAHAGSDEQARHNFSKLQLSMMNYISNVTDYTPEAVDRLHGELGIVNFGRYNKEQLFLANTVTNPDTLVEQYVQDRNVSVLISGQNGDHNGASIATLADLDTHRTLPFELKTASGLKKVIEFLDRRGLQVNHLSIVGHGGESGLHISNELILGHTDARVVGGPEHITPDANPLMQNILNRIQPNPDTGLRDVVLLSCSQAARFSRNMSLTERTAMAAQGMSVTGAEDTLYVHKSERPGHATFMQDNPDGGRIPTAITVQPARGRTVRPADGAVRLGY